MSEGAKPRTESEEPGPSDSEVCGCCGQAYTGEQCERDECLSREDAEFMDAPMGPAPDPTKVEGTPTTPAEMNASFGDSTEFMRACFRLEEMRRSGEFCCIDLRSDHHYVWDVWYERVTEAGGHSLQCASENMVPHEQLALAINQFWTRWKTGELD
jgi:hypothetical protein